MRATLVCATLAITLASLFPATVAAQQGDEAGPATAAASEPALPAESARKPLPAGDAVTITMSGAGFFGGDVAMAAQVFRPAGDGPFPVVVFSHGARPRRWNART